MKRTTGTHVFCVTFGLSLMVIVIYICSDYFIIVNKPPQRDWKLNNTLQEIVSESNRGSNNIFGDIDKSLFHFEWNYRAHDSKGCKWAHLPLVPIVDTSIPFTMNCYPPVEVDPSMNLHQARTNFFQYVYIRKSYRMNRCKTGHTNQYQASAGP